MANPAFDALSFEVWVPLLTGGCCVVLSDRKAQTPERLAAALRHERVDTVFVTTALFNAMVTAVPDCFASVGEVLVGGEQLNPHVMHRWYRDNADSGTRLFNIYGPTESTTFALCHPIPRDFDGDVVPIGRPLPQTGAVPVVPGQERVAAPGEVGELLLSGAGLAVGYRNLPEETKRRFVRLPWLDGGEEPYYRTGDLVRADDEGLLEYVGRTDRQVKVRGFRIEPGEVERRVLTHPAVQRAYVCTRRAGQEGPNELLAFVVLQQELSYEEFDSHLAAHLPAYMRPHQIHLVAELPLNANGKIDQAALLRQADRPWRPASPGSDGPPMTETERRVIELAEEILGTTGLGLGDRWIASGGDSLKALRFCFAVRRRWGRELTQAAVLHGDLAAVALSLATVGPGEESAVPATGGLRGPLGARHQRTAAAVADGAPRPGLPGLLRQPGLPPGRTGRHRCPPASAAQPGGTPRGAADELRPRPGRPGTDRRRTVRPLARAGPAGRPGTRKKHTPSPTPSSPSPSTSPSPACSEPAGCRVTAAAHSCCTCTTSPWTAGR